LFNKLEVVCLFPFPYWKATNTESSFVFVAFSYPSPSKMQRKSMLSSFLLLFLTRLPQKCNENRCFPHFCCFFLPVFLKNATKNDAFLIFVAFSYHFLSEIQRILGFSSILLLFHFPLAQRYNKNEIFLLFCRISSPVSFSSTAKNE
jgi:hypothetical protein